MDSAQIIDYRVEPMLQTFSSDSGQDHFLPGLEPEFRGNCGTQHQAYVIDTLNRRQGMSVHNHLVVEHVISAIKFKI